MPPKQKKATQWIAFCALNVPGKGLEPLRLTAHAPQTCLSTNFNTRAGIRPQRSRNLWNLTNRMAARDPYLLMHTQHRHRTVKYNVVGDPFVEKVVDEGMAVRLYCHNIHRVIADEMQDSV